MTKDFLLSYDTVYLRPNYSYLHSRSNADTSVDFLGKRFELPVIPANMKDVISFKNAEWLSENKYFYIMHRFDNNTKMFIKNANFAKMRLISISIGTTDYKEIIDYIVDNNYRVDYITIDVAHAHHENIENVVCYFREKLTSETKLIAGNVATCAGVEFLYNLGVDAIKVGIGQGSICSTKFKTGFHLPTLHSVYEANNVLKDKVIKVPIIADGGLKHYGDIAKALTFGASMVMSGAWFASCIDSPAAIVKGKKIYRGSTSFEAKNNNKNIEGITLELEEGITYWQRMEEIKQALSSAISYAGGDDLSAFEKVKWERIYPQH